MNKLQHLLVGTLLTSIAACQHPNLAPVASMEDATRTVAATEPKEDSFDKYRPHFRLGKKLDLQLAAHPEPSAETVAKIKGCIDELSNLENPGVGFSSTMTGSAFLPIPEQTQAQMMLLTDHKLKANAALKALVEWGPDALPYLLQALDDKRATKLAIKHDFGMGGMWFSNELDRNPANPAEAKALSDFDRKDGKHLSEYTVRIGDICFVAIGQIVGRSYNAVRYQPTACVILNSPVEDPDLCRRVREIWSSDKPWNKVLDSMLTDYATEAAFNGESLDGWDSGSQMQIDSAMRLLYYFPDEIAPAIAQRLRKLDVSKAKDIHDYIRRCVANGVRACEFVEAVSHSPNREVRQAVQGVFSRTDDYMILLSAMPAVDDKTLIHARLEQFLNEVRSEEQGAFTEGTSLLHAALEQFGDNSEPLFQAFLRVDSTERAYIVTAAFGNVNTKWSDAILMKMLDDRRPLTGLGHGITSQDDENRLDIRVCDSAAETMSAHHKELNFNMVGTVESLDNQIAAIKKILADKPQ